MMHISIHKNSRYGWASKIYSNSPFFSDNIVCVNLHDQIIFARPTLDYSGKQHKPTKRKYGYDFGVAFELPLGKFKIDEEESNEDCLVVYFKDKI